MALRHKPFSLCGQLPIRTNARSRSPDGEAGQRAWDTYGKLP